MNESDTLMYVRASAAVLRLPLDDEQVLRVAAHLQRTAAMARMLDDLAMPAETELAEIYKPKTPVTPGNVA